MTTTTQWIWQECLQMPPFLPKDPLHGRCWLCGGQTEHGWRVKDALSGAFTDHNIAAFPGSDIVCDCCVALMRKETWEPACAQHGHSPYFPAVEGKKPFMANWMFSSHLFAGKTWLRPSRADLRAILLDPPADPFVLTVAVVGKKHVIFRAPINRSREAFAVQLDESTLLVQRDAVRAAIELVERGMSFGLSRDGILTGNYHPASVMTAGLQRWREIERDAAGYRQRQPDDLTLACHCAAKQELIAKDPVAAILPPAITAAKPAAKPAQMELF